MMRLISYYGEVVVNIRNKLFKLKGYLFPLDKKWDDINLSPENIKYYVPKVLDYQSERFIDGKPTKEYIIASSGKKLMKI